jgi:type I restriction enzyme S subunit
MSFPRYPKYKQSGLEFLGKVPEHWNVMPIRRLIQSDRRITYGIVQPGEPDENGRFMVRGQDYSSGWVDSNAIFRVSDEIEQPYKRSRLACGDLVITIVGAGVGNLAMVPDWLEGANITQTTARIAIDKSKADPQFVQFVLESAVGQRSVGYFAKGAAQPGLNLEHLKLFQITQPPFNEQLAIASFLDHETAKIDALIAEQQRLIELLKEKRQAVISHAVTKGLNPHVRMKDSGVEWLGEVPEHWEVRRIGTIFRETNISGSDELPILSVSIHDGVSDKEFSDEEMDRKVTRSADRSKYKKVDPGDLVYNMMRAWQGGFGTVEVSGMVSPAYVVAKPNIKGITKFIEKLLRTPQAIEQMRRHSRGITDFRLRLYWDEFRNLKVVLPPDKEIQAIFSSISEIESRFLKLSDTCETTIQLLQERRTALISAAVTGQIDVRGFQPVAA